MLLETISQTSFALTVVQVHTLLIVQQIWEDGSTYSRELAQLTTYFHSIWPLMICL
jgi:hypothetical protein